MGAGSVLTAYLRPLCLYLFSSKTSVTKRALKKGVLFQLVVRSSLLFVYGLLSLPILNTYAFNIAILSVGLLTESSLRSD